MIDARTKLGVLMIASVGCSVPPHAEPSPEVDAGRAGATEAVQPPTRIVQQPKPMVPPPKPVDALAEATGCVREGPFEQVCIPVLPEGVASCDDCDLACINRVFRRLRDGRKVAGLACEVPPVTSGEGCCFSAKVIGHWHGCGGM